MPHSLRPAHRARAILSLAILLIPLLTGSLASGQAMQTPPGPGPWVVRAYYTDREMVNQLAAWREPWEVHHDQDYLVVDVNPAQYEKLAAVGFRLEIDALLTAQLNQPRTRLPGQIQGIPGFACYRTVEETFATAQNIVATHPTLAAWVDIGDSWEKTANHANGYDLMVLRLTNSAIPGPKPKLFVMTSVHAREYTPAELNTRFAEYIVDNYDSDPDATWLLDYHEIHLLLQANPDGRKKAEAGLAWRKNTNNDYCSDTVYRGADLDRNFEFQWGCCGGASGNVCDELYRGPSAASEPETQAIQSYVRSQFPDQRPDILTVAAPITATGVFLNIGSFSELVTWPWGFISDTPPNSTALQTLGRKFAYWNGYWPEQDSGLYPSDGTADDFAYGELGLATFAFELGTAFFQNCNVFENTILPDNLPALTYAAKVSRTPYLTPAGPDVLDVTVPPGAIVPGRVAQLAAAIDDTRYNNVNGAEPAQNIAAAEYYIDVPPWVTTTVPIPYPMLATDGNFDENVEAVEATIDTTDLSAGRHIIFVRGQDVTGNWGSFSAAFLYVIDAAISPTIEGYVRATGDNSPLEATITAGTFQTSTNPASGYYSMTVISGTYDLSAVAPGHAISTVTGVEVYNYQNVRQDFYLYPVCEVFTDDVEAGNQGWTAGGSWAITTETSHSLAHSWTDSPGSEYGDDWDYSLLSPVFDLSDYGGVSLNFWHTYDLENGYDYGHLEYSTNGGDDWTTIATYDGENPSPTWGQEDIDLATLDGQSNARVRFRLETDTTTTKDGWHIDDVVLTGGGLACMTTSEDIYEPDDTCAEANALITDSAVQPHTFHQHADEDWVRFTVISGTTYVLQAASTSPGANLVLELYDACAGDLQGLDDNAFGTDALILFTAPSSGVYYARALNHDPDVYGAGVTYELSVRAQVQDSIVLIVAGNDDGYRLQDNILYAANLAYRTFLNAGIPRDHIRYLSAVDDDSRTDADGDGVSDVHASSASANVEAAITAWAAGLADSDIPFYVYMIDHGEVDAFLTLGNGDIITPTELDGWLNTLESATGTLVNVIYEACHSGSFIDGLQEISEPGRVVIASTGRANNAYAATGRGAYFSDAFFTALGQSHDLYTSFQWGVEAVEATGLWQTPWLDDDGDGTPNTASDGQVTRGRGLTSFAFAAERPPVVDEVLTPTFLSSGGGILQAQVRDDTGVARVWVEVYGPSFVEPEPAPAGTTPDLNLPQVHLSDTNGDGTYTGVYEDFVEGGVYRLVVYAEDGAGNLSQPGVLEVRVWAVYLPLALKQ